MAADARIGAECRFRLGLNEVRIGLTLPWFAIVLARHRPTQARLDQAAVTSDMFDPQTAREAGPLDTVASPLELDSVGLDIAQDLRSGRALSACRDRVRTEVLNELRASFEAELI